MGELLKVSLVQLLVSLKVFTRDEGWGGVGWDGSRVGPVRKDLKSEFVAVLVSMLSMLMQVRSKKGGGERGLVFNKCIHFVFGSRHSITRLSFLLSYDVLFMMIGTMNHLP